MKKQSNRQRLGWVPDLPDHRDHLYAAPPHIISRLPSSVDLRKQCPPVYDQGDLGSCTANAIGAAIQFEQMKQKKKPFIPSRLFIYYNERAMEHTISSDSGAQIRDGIKSVNKLGVCPETLWPYSDDKTHFLKKPVAGCYKTALDNQVVSYQRVTQTLMQLKGCLANGYPFVFGFTVYDNMYSAAVTKTGHLSLPGPNDKMEGGHAVMAVGYDDRNERFIIRNSWGSKWAMKGYFTLPYSYITDSNLADDFWTIRMVE
ncbi:MAG TPA: C1 family peptidase [Bacteroidia bacterium]|nr:C1 family peptidase [Bacteroidia bacterium]